MTMIPETLVRRVWLSKTAFPKAVADSPRLMNTAAKPAMNRAVSRAIRPMWRRGSSCTSAVSRPVTMER